MQIPWKLLMSTALWPLDYRVYAVLVQFSKLSAEGLAEMYPGTPADFQGSLDRLCQAGFIREVPPATPVGVAPEGSYRYFSIYRNPRRTRSSLSGYRENRNDRARARVDANTDLRARGSCQSRLQALVAYEQELTTGEFSPAGVLGCFYFLYKQHTGLDYRGASFREELREAELLAYTARTEAIWCVRALFAPQLAWVKNKSLTFLSNANNVHKFVLGAAVELRKRESSRPEWSGVTAPAGEWSGVSAVHRPRR